MAKYIVEIPVRVLEEGEPVFDYHLQPPKHAITIPVEASSEAEAVALANLMLAGAAIEREQQRAAEHFAASAAIGAG